MSPSQELHAAWMRTRRESIYARNISVVGKTAHKPRTPLLKTPGATVASEIADRYGLSLQAVLQVRQRRGLIQQAQTELALRLREQGWSYPQIGRFMGHRHHTSIFYLLRKSNPVLRKIQPAPEPCDLDSGSWV